uniref:C-C motif chemokine receptor 6 n=1 Tax=Salvator merianae TaxID=96440 RepID=A0A8D0KNG6_SALMN
MSTSAETTTMDYSDYYFQIATLCNKDEVRNFTKTFLPITYSLICIFGLVGNLCVVLTFISYKKSESMTDMYLCNMAIVDILFVLTLPFWAVYYALDEWIFGDFVCKLFKGIYAVNFNCGMLLLTCISMDRYIAIVQATRLFKVRTRTLAYSKAICLAVWLLAVLISTSAFMFNGSYSHSGNATKHICEHKSTAEFSVILKLLILSLQLLFGFFIPLLFMCFCYTFIVKTLIHAQNSKKSRAIRAILLIMLVFLVCQLPYNIVLLMTAMSLGKQDKTCQGEKQMAYAKYITETLAFLHCCMNPVLYAFIGVKFRNYFMKIIMNLCCTGHTKCGSTYLSRLSSDTGHSRPTSEICE